MVIDKRAGFFVNRDLAGYEVPVHAGIPHQDVIFLDKVDPYSSPIKARASTRPSPMLFTTRPTSEP